MIAYEIMGNDPHTSARQGGLSKVGHMHEAVEKIIAVRHDGRRYILVFKNVLELNQLDLDKDIKKAVSTAVPCELVDGIAAFEAAQNSLETGAKSRLYFDRATFV